MQGYKFKGTDVCERLLKSFISSNRKIVVYFDPDVDGMIAGYFVCKYLAMYGKPFSWYVNTNRSHNWDLDLEKVKDCNVVAVDFMIPKQVMQDIIDNGTNIISMDHHVNGDSFIHIMSKGEGVIINNQYPFEDRERAYLSGAGVVFETLSNLDSNFYTNENKALVGLTLLSDVCNIENTLAKEYLTALYNHKYKGYIRYLIDGTMGDKDWGFGVPRLDRKYVEFKFSPAVNACLRFNKETDVVKFFLCTAKLDLTYREEQKKLIKKMLKIVEVREFERLRVVFLNDWDKSVSYYSDVLSNFIGLIASRYLDGKKSVLAYLISKDVYGKRYVKRASFRGHINGADYLKESKGIIEGIGHQSAFGILNLKPNKQLFEKVNIACKKAEEGYINGNTIIPVTNLAIFADRKGKRCAEHNMYCLAQNNTYVRYIGNNVKVISNTSSFQKYKVDGIEVKCFDSSIDFTNGVIYPILERGFIYYYLQKEN